MKQINFIVTLSPAKQHELSQWYRLSVILTCCVCLSIIVCQSIQLIRYIQFQRSNSYWKSQQMPLHHFINKKRSLIQKKLDFEKKYNDLKEVSLQSPVLKTFDTCIKLLKKPVFVHTLTVTHNQVISSIKCAKPAQVFAYTQALVMTESFSSVTINQLKACTENQTTTIQATIKAAIK